MIYRSAPCSDLCLQVWFIEVPLALTILWSVIYRSAPFYSLKCVLVCYSNALTRAPTYTSECVRYYSNVLTTIGSVCYRRALSLTCTLKSMSSLYSNVQTHIFTSWSMLQECPNPHFEVCVTTMSWAHMQEESVKLKADRHWAWFPEESLSPALVLHTQVVNRLQNVCFLVFLFLCLF